MSGLNILVRTAEFLRVPEGLPEPFVALHDHWHAISPTGGIAFQRDFDLHRFRSVLDHLALAQIVAEPPTARYLLVGRALQRLLGEDPTGRFVDQIYSPDIAAEVLSAFRKTHADRQPSAFKREFRVLGHSFGYQRLLLPLRAGQQGQSARVLVCILPLSSGLISARQWRSVLQRRNAILAREQEFQRAWATSLGYTVNRTADEPG